MKELKEELITYHRTDSKLRACKEIGKYFDITLKARKELCDKYWNKTSESCADNIIKELKDNFRLKAEVENPGDEERTKSFLKEAFCIDGECELIIINDIQKILQGKTSALYELNDSKRGKFYITISQ